MERFGNISKIIIIFIIVSIFLFCKGGEKDMNNDGSKIIVELILFPTSEGKMLYIRLKDDGNYKIYEVKKFKGDFDEEGFFLEEGFFEERISKEIVIKAEDLLIIKKDLAKVKKDEKIDKRGVVDRPEIILKIDNCIFRFFLGFSGYDYLDRIVENLIRVSPIKFNYSFV